MARSGIVLLLIFVFVLYYKKILWQLFCWTLFVAVSILILFYLLLLFGLWPLSAWQRHCLLFQTHVVVMLNLPLVLSFTFFLVQLLLSPEASCHSELVVESAFWKQEAQKAIQQSEQTISTLIDSLTQYQQRLSLLEEIFHQHCGPPRHLNHPWKGPGSSLLWSFYGLLAHAFCLELIPNDFSAHTAAMFSWTHRGLPPEVRYWSMYYSNWGGFFYQGASFIYSFVDLQRVFFMSYGPASTTVLFSQSPVFATLDDTFVEAQQELSTNIFFLKSLQNQIDLLKSSPPGAEANHWQLCCQKASLIEGQALVSSSQTASVVAKKSWFLTGSLGFVSRTYGKLALLGFFEAGILSSTATAVYLYSPDYFPSTTFALSYWQQGLWELGQGFQWARLCGRYLQSANSMEVFALDFCQWKQSTLSEHHIVRCCFQVTYPGFSEDFLMWSLLDQWHKAGQDLQQGFLIWGIQGPEPGEFARAINYPTNKLPVRELSKLL